MVSRYIGSRTLYAVKHSWHAAHQIGQILWRLACRRHLRDVNAYVCGTPLSTYMEAKTVLRPCLLRRKRTNLHVLLSDAFF